MNVVMNNGGAFVEVQGTAEGHAFRRHELDALLNLAAHGIGELFALQAQALSGRDARIVLASGNPGKLREFAAAAGAAGARADRRRARFGIEPAEETGTTFVENALLKARHAARHARLPALADDSGIEVDALGGRPGVWSARFAGPAASDAENTPPAAARAGRGPGRLPPGPLPVRHRLGAQRRGPGTAHRARHLGGAYRPRRRAAAAASATTRCSCPRASNAPPRSCRPRRRTPSATVARRSPPSSRCSKSAGYIAAP